MKKGVRDWKVWTGVLISLLFLFLAFRKVDFAQMWDAFQQANYWYFVPALLIMFAAHFLRALRWQYLLEPIHKVGVGTLYSSLLIGYMANTFLPAHLGEFLRAYMVGKKKPVPASAVFGTIVIERIIDVFTLLVLMAAALIVFPFPGWVTKSGYISFGFIAALFVVLLMMKKYRDPALNVVEKLLRPFPAGFKTKVNDMLHSFLDGVAPLKKWHHYVTVTVLSMAIWFCYGYIFQLSLYAFDFITLYDLPWTASLVLLVITTISVVVPSSPGYVGTYHYLCQLSLAMFGVPESPALTFAFVVHAINFFPVLIAGLILISIEGMSLKTIQRRAEEEAEEIEEEIAD